jgi:4-hydroxybenzoyl-CoA thioesterase
VFVYERPVRFEDVDAAGIVFFARFFNACHEAMEAFFGAIDGGYARLITERKVGVPAVKVEAQYKAPLRYGDVILIDVRATQVGRTSATLRYEFRRKADGVAAATIDHKVVCCDLRTIMPIPLPDDVRAILSASLDSAGIGLETTPIA